MSQAKLKKDNRQNSNLERVKFIHKSEYQRSKKFGCPFHDHKIVHEWPIRGLNNLEFRWETYADSINLMEPYLFSKPQHVLAQNGVDEFCKLEKEWDTNKPKQVIFHAAWNLILGL